MPSTIEQIWLVSYGDDDPIVINWYCRKQAVDCTVSDSDDAFTEDVNDVEQAGLIGGKSASVGRRVENSPDRGF